MAIKEIDDAAFFQSELQELLAFATSKAEEEYRKYTRAAHKKLYAYMMENEVAGCIGIEFLANNRCEIKHIAVFSENRRRHIGSEMISDVCRKHTFSSILAETDRDAVGFYRKNGFIVMSLGEKYPGRERFLCRRKCQGAH